jgi:hypothetical protein
MPDGAEGPSAHSCQPASSQIKRNSMRVMTLGAFGARPPAYVPNKQKIIQGRQRIVPRMSN